MLTPSQIAEMANNAAKAKYKIELMAADSGRLGYDLVQNLKHTIADFKQDYIAAFTDAMKLMSKEWVSVEEYDLLKQQLNNVRDTATQYIRKQEYNKHYLPHLYNARVFTGSVILEIANDFKALVLPEPPKL